MRNTLKNALAEADEEIKRIEENIADLQKLKRQQQARKAEAQRELDALGAGGMGGGKAGRKALVDYFKPREWSEEMKR